MKSLYDYENNITITTTPNGDKVVTMNDAIFAEILVAMSNGRIWEKEQGYEATAERTRELWTVLYNKSEASEQ